VATKSRGWRGQAATESPGNRPYERQRREPPFGQLAGERSPRLFCKRQTERAGRGFWFGFGRPGDWHGARGGFGVLQTLHPTAAVVVSFAVYLADVNGAPEQPVSVPLMFTVWMAAVFVNPGFSAIVPVLPVHIVFSTV
jgi:hypothetical protein